MSKGKYSRLPTTDQGDSDGDRNVAGSFAIELRPIGENGVGHDVNTPVMPLPHGKQRKPGWGMMGPKRRLAFVLSVIFAGSIVILFLVLPQLMDRERISKKEAKRPVVRVNGKNLSLATWDLSPADGDISWSVDFPGLGVESSVRLFDVNDDGIRDVLVGFYVGARQHLRATKVECDLVRLPFPCYGGVLALNGRDGTLLWRYAAQGEIFAVICGSLDVNQDNVPECIVGGRRDALDAIDVRTGKSLWPGKTQFDENWNFYTPWVIRDVDSDGVDDLLVVHGGLVDYPPAVLCRNASAVLLISGKTGCMIGSPVPTPDAKESYMSPVISTVGYGPGEKEIVFIGTGGETVSGSLWAFTLENVISLAKGKPATQWSWGKCQSLTKSAVIHLADGYNHGVAVPPVMADLTSDGILDIVISVFDGQVIVRDGADCSVVWKRSFEQHEYYSSPALGRFDDDSVPDLIFQMNHGAWWNFSYVNSVAYVLSGSTGKTLWSFKARGEVFSSPLSILRQPDFPGGDVFLFWTSGRQVWKPTSWSKTGCTDCGTSDVFEQTIAAISSTSSPTSLPSSIGKVEPAVSLSVNQSVLSSSSIDGISTATTGVHNRAKRHGSVHYLDNEKTCPPELVERSKKMDKLLAGKHTHDDFHRAGCNVDENSYTAEVFLMDNRHSCQLVRLLSFPSVDYKSILSSSRHRRHGDKEEFWSVYNPPTDPPSEDPSLCARMRIQPRATGAIGSLGNNSQLSFAYTAPFLAYVTKRSDGGYVRNEYFTRIGVKPLMSMEPVQLVGKVQTTCSDGSQQLPVEQGIFWKSILALQHQPWLGYLGTCAQSTFSLKERKRKCGVAD